MVGTEQKRKTGLTILALLCLSLACGCTSVYFCAVSEEIIRFAPEDRPFEIIGPVHALTWQWVLFYYVPIGPTHLEAEVLLMREAKRLNADAVIDVRFHTENDSDETSLSHFGLTGIIPFLMNTRAYHFSGLAIRYTDGGDK